MDVVCQSSREIGSDVVRELVDRPNPILMDIGCNTGTHTFRMLGEMPNARVYCFEPDVRPLAKFSEKFADDLNVVLFRAAVSDKMGFSEFHGSSGQIPATAKMPDWWDGSREDWHESGSLAEPKEHLDVSPWTTFPPDKVFTTATVSLDWVYGILVAPCDIDYIHMDVQGTEHLVFFGGKHALYATRWIYTEYSDRELYKGQRNLEQLCDILKGTHSLHSTWSSNALFKRLT